MYRFIGKPKSSNSTTSNVVADAVVIAAGAVLVCGAGVALLAAAVGSVSWLTLAIVTRYARRGYLSITSTSTWSAHARSMDGT
jgi:hypothetical protein